VIERSQLWNDLLKAERKSRSGKTVKLLRSPFFYPGLLSYNYAIYPLFKKGISFNAKTFFGVRMNTVLPSGTDIVLNGIKSHDSEIRLTKYLVRHLQAGDTFIDVGAHYGYYSLLASVLVGKNGHVFSIEPAETSFNVLKKNVSSIQNIEIVHAAASEKEGVVTFFEYPGPLAEYNTTVAGAYENAGWYRHVEEKEKQIRTLALDQLVEEHKISNAIIKIDVEGGEASVLRGMKTSLRDKQFIVVMEYLLSTGGNKLHQDAAHILLVNGYKSFAITPGGELEEVNHLEEYLLQKKLTSDNIIYIK
jgi:FkbM family methyltransferase